MYPRTCVIAFRRLTITKRPMSSVASPTGTVSGEPARVAGNWSRASTHRANTSEDAPTRTESVWPTKGSTSRRTPASRRTRSSTQGKIAPLTATPPAVRTQARAALSPPCRSRGSRLTTTPWTATTRIQLRSRLDPSSRRSVMTRRARTASTPEPRLMPSPQDQHDRQQRQRRRPHEQLRNAHEAEARHRGLHDTDDDTQDGHPADERARVQQRVAAPHGHGQPHQERPQQPELERRPVQDERQVRPAMVQHHDLMDHGQLQVSGWIVHGDTRRLGDQDDT